MRTRVTISRKWNNPLIKTTICNHAISLEMDMDDFTEALKQEIGKITWVFKKETFDKILDEAIQRIISEVKKESAKVV